MPRKRNEEIPYQALVILTITERKNLMQSVIVLCLYDDVIQRYGAPKNLSPSESTKHSGPDSHQTPIYTLHY